LTPQRARGPVLLPLGHAHSSSPAIITGFGIKLGTDIYKYVKERSASSRDLTGRRESVQQAAGKAAVP
jgi:hypothetical protein